MPRRPLSALFALRTVGGLMLLMMSYSLLGCSAAGGTRAATADYSAASLRPEARLASASPPASDLALASAFATSGGKARGGDALRVMSFNLRVPFALDFLNHWTHRKDLVVETIQRFGPDVLGVQECHASQAAYLQRHLPGYAFVGAGRDDGELDGEMTGIFYRRDRFTQLSAGHFWLSESPHVPGSKSWGAWWTRMVTWVQLQPRTPDGAGGKPFYLFNTHFDNISHQARVASAKLLRSRIRVLAGDAPVLITGDFNTDAGTAPYHFLTHHDPATGPGFIDTFRQLHPQRLPDEGTHGGFNGSRGGPRIDWILASPDTQVLNAGIDYTHHRGRYPSDHRPVLAIVRLAPGTAPEGPSTPATPPTLTAQVATPPAPPSPNNPAPTTR